MSSADSSADLPLITDLATLRESYPEPDLARERVAELRQQLRAAPDEIAELTVRGDLVDLLRRLDELDDALREAQAAAERADIAGGPAQQHLARARLAQVHAWRGQFAESTPMFTELLAAALQFGPVIEAYTHQLAGLNDYRQGLYPSAADHFARAVRVRTELELDELEASRVALEAAQRKAQEQP